ncbi:histone-like nucleoid-structuring protein Lsr2 [Streptomyces californicus]|uniref:Lsr2 family DNA-binding protein n=1 Tax=Streptomyces californicus TaxID=67351 RepID=UPI00368982F2
MAFDTESVRAYMVRKGLRTADDYSDITPPEVRFYAQYKPSDDARDERERLAREASERMWEQAREAQERMYRMKEHMRKAREWGRENGFFVGTRGRIPARVWSAYQESIGEQL